MPLDIDAETNLINIHCGLSSRLFEKLTKCLPHKGSINQINNKIIYMKIEEVIRGNTVASSSCPTYCIHWWNSGCPFSAPPAQDFIVPQAPTISSLANKFPAAKIQSFMKNRKQS